ncbi:MAG: hypothetical protein IPK33_05240 [Gemmatimonadetes bacterium]|nr:hypothetical protein [Gemmatimonadota bacterium]MCC6430475.1 hypothetical protein [Gemmatimonadaceae bacterium]
MDELALFNTISWAKVAIVVVFLWLVLEVASRSWPALHGSRGPGRANAMATRAGVATVLGVALALALAVDNVTTPGRAVSRALLMLVVPVAFTMASAARQHQLARAILRNGALALGMTGGALLLTVAR